MSDVLRFDDRSPRVPFALSIVCFGFAGVTNTTVATDARTVVAAGSAVVGTYCLARYAARIPRTRHVRVALALWMSFFAVAGLHAVGPATLTATLPVTAETVTGVLAGSTWLTFPAAGSITVFLGFREYGAGTPVHAVEDPVVDGDAEY